MRRLIISALLLRLAVATQAQPSASNDVSNVVATIMKTFEGGAMLVEPPPGEVVNQDGWTMRLPSGKQVWRSDLVRQCSAITPYGWRAVPELLRWLDHKEDYMRYVAARSLKEITGLDPRFYYFYDPHNPAEGESGWFDKAKNTWSKWYDDLARKERAGA